MRLKYLDTQVKYIIYLAVTYIIAFLISMITFIPEAEIFQRGTLIMQFSLNIYFIIRISQAVWRLDFCTSSPWCYYITRVMFTVVLFVLHFILMHTSISISGNLMISGKIIRTIQMPVEHTTFYIYDDGDDNINYNTAVAVRQSFLPIHKKICSNELICPETLTVSCANGFFVFSDGDCVFSYPCKYHQKYGYDYAHY